MSVINCGFFTINHRHCVSDDGTRCIVCGDKNVKQYKKTADILLPADHKKLPPKEN